MANFMFQVDLATGCPDIWLYAILNVSGRVFPDKVSIRISRLSKDYPQQCSWASCNPSRA